MSRLLSNAVFKGIAIFLAARSCRNVLGSFFENGLKYLTTVPIDPDTHEDFRPTNKVQGSAVSLKDVVEQDLKENTVMIYMKGVPNFPQCGFSRKGVETIHYWPTFPQIFIKGEFIGGSDIVLNMHQTGELKEKLKGIAASPK